MSGPVRMSVVADTKDAVRGMGAAGGAALDMGRDFDKAAAAAKEAAPKLEGVGEGADTVASKGAQAAGALSGLGDLMGGPFGAAMVVGGTAMQAAADAGDLLNVAVEGGGKLLAKGASAMSAFANATGLSTVASKIAAGAQWALNAAMSANPILIVVVALAAMTAGLVIAYKKVGWFRDGVNAAFGFIKSLFLNFTPLGYVISHFDDLVGYVRGLPGRIGRAASGMFDGIKDAFRGSINWIIDGWNHLEFKIPGIKVPGPLPDIPGFTLSTPNIPRLAGGGIVIAGDNPSGIEAIVPLERAGQFGFGRGPLTINLRLSAPALSRLQRGREIVESLTAYANAGGEITVVTG